MSPRSFVYPMSLLAVATMAVSGCDRNDQRTPGAKVDAALEATERKADEVKAQAAELADKAKESLERLTASAGEAAAEGKDTLGRAAAAGKDKLSQASAVVGDATLTAEVKAGLAAEMKLVALKIGVDTDRGVVTLSGVVPDKDTRQRAAEIAAAPRGVSRVDNRLSVQGS